MIGHATLAGVQYCNTYRYSLSHYGHCTQAPPNIPRVWVAPALSSYTGCRLSTLPSPLAAVPLFLPPPVPPGPLTSIAALYPSTTSRRIGSAISLSSVMHLPYTDDAAHLILFRSISTPSSGEARNEAADRKAKEEVEMGWRLNKSGIITPAGSGKRTPCTPERRHISGGPRKR